MLYGFIFGLVGVISFVHTNNNLQRKYYRNLSNSKDKWKASPEITKTLNDNTSWFPLSPYYVGEYTPLQKYHYMLSLVVFVLVNMIAVETYMQGYTKLHLTHISLVYLPFDVLVSLLINNFFYYYYHRLAHHRYFYKYVHSYHHAFPYPKPFDSLIGHPLDHSFAALWQILPMFIYRMHLLSFLAYSSILSLMGIWDHSGIKFKYFNYRSIDHHIHHKHPSKNFSTGFPILIFDILHGTFQENI
jgi:sterol desaturase/sphingolipid hydroxylase (fatty acid hydroxylase superfamily)